MENKVIKSYKIKNLTFEIVSGDLLKEETDVIVNAANSYLSHGGGIAAVIERAAGEELKREGDKIVREKGPIPTGEAVMTSAGKLPFKGVIHCVGPRFGEGEEGEKLKKAIKNAFKIAEDKSFKSLSFPAVSSGIFGVPKDICAKAYAKAVLEFSREDPKSLKNIRIVLFKDEEMEKILEKEMEKLKP